MEHAGRRCGAGVGSGGQQSPELLLPGVARETTPCPLGCFRQPHFFILFRK